jgi:hypothetical protein
MRKSAWYAITTLLIVLIIGLWENTHENGLAAHVESSSSYSLRFYGHGTGQIDRVKIPIDNPPVPADIGAGDFTIEFWMRAAAAHNTSGPCTGGGDNWTNGNIIIDRDIFGAGDYGDFGVSLYGGRIAFGAANTSTAQTVCSTVAVADNAWHHIALTRRSSDGRMQIFVDGNLSATGYGPTGNLSYRDGRSTSWPNDPFLVFGAEKHDYDPGTYPSYHGYLDEVRLSTVLRYTADFTPPTAPFVPDAHTAALYHFDEGPAGPCTGTVVDSASGGQSPGTCHYGGSGTAGPVYTTDTPFIGSPTSTPTPTATATPTRTPTPSGTLIFADSFESGTLGAWSGAVTDGSDLAVTTAAALVGARGLQATVNDNNPLYVRDTRPANETRYRLRFRFHPNGIAMADGDAHTLFAARQGSTEVFRLLFRRSGGNYQLRGQIRNDATTYTATSWFTITNAAQVIEIEWQAATAPGANNGLLRLWLNGALRQTLSGIDNDTRRVDEVRLGPQAGIDNGTRGVMFFDHFESWRP